MARCALLGACRNTDVVHKHALPKGITWLHNKWPGYKVIVIISSTGLLEVCQVTGAHVRSFMAGYHVHEKAALMVTVPLALNAVRSRAAARDWQFLSATAHYALLPLLFTLAEYPIKACSPCALLCSALVSHTLHLTSLSLDHLGQLLHLHCYSRS